MTTKQQPGYKNFRMWAKTLKVLKFIAAHTGESLLAIVDRLANQELDRLEGEDDRK